MKRPCTCQSCANDPLLLTGIGEHVYQLDTRYEPLPSGGEDRSWRWLCACGGRGRYQYQSDSVAFHAWRVHARLEVRR